MYVYTRGHSPYLLEEIVGLRAEVILYVLLERVVQWGEVHNDLCRRVKAGKRAFGWRSA